MNQSQRTMETNGASMWMEEEKERISISFVQIYPLWASIQGV
jgi:hypothetical protein